jgi:hypothetical protein
MRQIIQPIWACSGSASTPASVVQDQSFGSAQTVEWIARGTRIGRTITSAIPAVFESYATFVDVEVDLLEGGDDAALVEQERAVVGHLDEYGPHAWWLGYLDTGSHDVVFPMAKRVTLYEGWAYVIVKAGPEQALQWRDTLPDLIFPQDRSWFVSMLWDDDWTCVGGPKPLIDALVADTLIAARAVGPDKDAAPPGGAPS